MTLRFRLINPNTSAATTAMMLEIAREALAGRAGIDGMTAARGAAVITTEAALAEASAEVVRMAAGFESGLERIDGVAIAAFGDPALAEVRAMLDVPVVGIAEAAIGEAAAGGRRFAIVTTTPALDDALRRRVAARDAGAALAGIRYTRSGAAGMASARLTEELHEACLLAIREDGAEAIIIGGGPLAAAARALRDTVPVALIEPIPAAMRALVALAVFPQTKEPTWPTP